MNGILKKDLRVVLTGVMIFISYQVYSNPESGTKEQGDVYRNLPFSMPEVSQPSFPDYEVNIRDFGALSDGVTLNTEAINNAIKAVTIVRMEVPCCGGLENAAKRALQDSGKFIPWQVVTISTTGKILDE